MFPAKLESLSPVRRSRYCRFSHKKTSEPKVPSPQKRFHPKKKPKDFSLSQFPIGIDHTKTAFLSLSLCLTTITETRGRVGRKNKPARRRTCFSTAGGDSFPAGTSNYYILSGSLSYMLP